jgi:predicted N-formylglutamate amidohydrolase
LVISCEHGGNDVPPAYAACFAGQDALLDTHRGWDPGALPLAQQMAAALGAPLYAATTTRLLVDLNRSQGHPRLYSELTRGLTRAQRQTIFDAHYRPHRDAVEGGIARLIAAGRQVVHVASHSFTPVLDGTVRRADVGWLYDPRRPAEAALARRWLAELAHRAPGLQLRRNYPYQGRGDGLASLLRKRFAGEAYVGLELEVNQRFALGTAPGDAQAWNRLRRHLTESLAAALADPADAPPAA